LGYAVKAALICDGCHAISTVASPYPVGWRRLNVWGRRGANATMASLYKIDVCSPECVDKAMPAAENVSPGLRAVQ
jgi:hypothetical protein